MKTSCARLCESTSPFTTSVDCTRRLDMWRQRCMDRMSCSEVSIKVGKISRSKQRAPQAERLGVRIVIPNDVMSFIARKFDVADRELAASVCERKDPRLRPPG